MERANLFAEQQPPTKRDQQLALVDLELAEAQLLSGNYASAANTAEKFVHRLQPGNEEILPYNPVAQLLIVAGNYLSGKVQDPLTQLENRLQPLPNGKPAALIKNLTTPSGQLVEVRISQWSFDTLDEYACQKLQQQKRAVVKQLSEMVQKKIDSNATLKPCT